MFGERDTCCQTEQNLYQFACMSKADSTEPSVLASDPELPIVVNMIWWTALNTHWHIWSEMGLI